MAAQQQVGPSLPPSSLREFSLCAPRGFFLFLRNAIFYETTAQKASPWFQRCGTRPLAKHGMALLSQFVKVPIPDPTSRRRNGGSGTRRCGWSASGAPSPRPGRTRSVAPSPAGSRAGKGGGGVVGVPLVPFLGVFGPFIPGTTPIPGTFQWIPREWCLILGIGLRSGSERRKLANLRERVGEDVRS